jgi:ADP-ribose pyrophosphatase
MTHLHPWQVLASEQLLDYSPWLRVLRQTVQLPNGHVIHDYLLTPARDYSMVVALTDDEQVLLVQQYKHGLGRVVYDFPAGYLETPAENPLAAAQRELLEETGYTARQWTPLGAYHLDTNRSATVAHLFLAQGLAQIAAQKLDDSEMLTHHLVHRSEVMALLQNGRMSGIGCAAAWGLSQVYLAEQGRRTT